MNWESVVIMGLCAFNLLTLLGLGAKLNQAPRANSPADVKPPKKSDGRVRLDAANSAGTPAPEPPKDNGSVILMTSERDSRLLQDQDD